MSRDSYQIKAISLIKCRNLLECILSLNPLEIDIFRLLTSEGPRSAEDIGKRLGKDRSTAYRALRQLQACQICFKEKINLELGGHQHIYHAIDAEKVRQELDARLEEWIAKMRKAIKSFPEDMIKSIEDEYGPMDERSCNIE